MGYIHLEIESVQTPKKNGSACGDAWRAIRKPDATTIIVADGIGSGIKANIYANMIISRFINLIDRGFSLRRAFSSIVHTMHDARGTDAPYAVFTVARILKNGEATILGYEMPEAIFIGRHSSSVVKPRNITLGHEIISETNLFLEPGEGIMMFSDGISQAGTGMGFKFGWESSGVSRFINDCQSRAINNSLLAQMVHAQAREHWRDARGDDCTVVSAFCREGKVVNIMTGPPINKADDDKVTGKFLSRTGIKIVCGATTSQVVARKLGKEVQINKAEYSMIAPPGYSIEGVDIVTEGAITLNQVYNIFEADSKRYEPDTSVTLLCDALKEADKVSFIVGRAENLGHKDIAFTQRGILPRQTIVKLLIEKLDAAGKLVEIEYV